MRLVRAGGIKEKLQPKKMPESAASLEIKEEAGKSGVYLSSLTATGIIFRPNPSFGHIILYYHYNNQTPWKQL